MTISEFERFFIKPDLQKCENFWIIYFLVDESGNIVYVGKSSYFRLSSRLNAHKKGKKFDSYFYIAGIKNESQAYQIESAFITIARPKYNKFTKTMKAIDAEQLAEWVRSDKPKYGIAKKERFKLSQKEMKYVALSLLIVYAALVVICVILKWYAVAIILLVLFFFPYPKKKEDSPKYEVVNYGTTYEN